MTRDELLLAALRDGEASTAALSLAAGLAERRVRAGLAHLAAVGYVWSPVRGRYGLTAAGAAIAAELKPLLAAEGLVEDSLASPAAAAAVPLGQDRVAAERVTAAASSAPRALLAIGALIAGLIALAAVVRGRLPSAAAGQPGSTWDRPDDLGRPWSW